LTFNTQYPAVNGFWTNTSCRYTQLLQRTIHVHSCILKCKNAPLPQTFFSRHSPGDKMLFYCLVSPASARMSFGHFWIHIFGWLLALLFFEARFCRRVLRHSCICVCCPFIAYVLALEIYWYCWNCDCCCGD